MAVFSIAPDYRVPHLSKLEEVKQPLAKPIPSVSSTQQFKGTNLGKSPKSLTMKSIAPKRL